MSKENISELVNYVRKDIEKQLQYKLNDEQLDELRLTGRVGISINAFAPYFYNLAKYLHTSPRNNCWTISLNTISLDLEISLQGSSIEL